MEQDAQTGIPGLELAEASYQRCCAVPEFYRHFYDNFLASDPRVPALFEGTEFAKQAKLLQHAIGLMLIFAKRKNPVMLERIADRHGSRDLNVPEDLYPAFVDSFIETVKQHDPEYADGLDDAWRAALEPGIRFMIQPH